jgi:RNA polymerase sigma-70 factor (ECF subfamily)
VHVLTPQGALGGRSSALTAPAGSRARDRRNVVQVDTREIWAAFSLQLRQFIRFRVRDDSQADDILQDVFAKIHARIDTLRDTNRIQPWVHQIARNAIADHFRSRKPVEQTPESLEAPEADPIELGLEEGLTCLQSMIRRLPSHYRKVIELSEIDGLSHRHIAARLGLTVSGVKSRVQRGRALLRESMLQGCRVALDSAGGPSECERRGGCGGC